MSTAASKIRQEVLAALHLSVDLGALLVPGNIIVNPNSWNLSPWVADGGLTVTPNGLQVLSNPNVYYTTLSEASASALRLKQAVSNGDAGTFTLSVDFEGGGAVCPRISIASLVADVVAVFFDPTDNQAHKDTGFPPDSVGVINLGNGLWRLWLTSALGAAIRTVAIHPAGCPLGGPYVLTPTATGTNYGANAALMVGTSAVFPSAANPERVFDGEATMVAGRSRGRLPFFEVFIEQQPFRDICPEGGTMETNVILRANCAGRDHTTALNLLSNMLALALATVRNSVDSVNGNSGYFKYGTSSIGKVEKSAFGWQQDAMMSVEHTYAAADFGHS